jgi:hypothetical protein
MVQAKKHEAEALMNCVLAVGNFSLTEATYAYFGTDFLSEHRMQQIRAAKAALDKYLGLVSQGGGKTDEAMRIRDDIEHEYTPLLRAFVDAPLHGADLEMQRRELMTDLGRLDGSSTSA